MSEENDNVHHESLKRIDDELKSVMAKASALRLKRERSMLVARKAGMTYSRIADAIGVTKAYVHQVVSRQLKDENES